MSSVIAVVVLVVLLAAIAWAGIKLRRATALARRHRQVRWHADDDFLTAYSRLLGLPQKRNNPLARPVDNCPAVGVQGRGRVGRTRRQVSGDELGNIGYVRRLWRAFETGGVAAMAPLVPPEVSWRPLEASGRALRGTEELDQFWSSREFVMPKLRMFHGYGDDVLVEAEYAHNHRTVRTVWLLYRFEGDRLVEAIACRNEADARSYSAATASA